MALPKLREISGNLFAGVAALGLVATPIAANSQTVSSRPLSEVSDSGITTTSRPFTQSATPANANDINVPMRDARNAGPSSVRFSAAQVTQTRPSIALLGVQRESWPTIRQGIEQAAANGYPVSIVLMGPTDAPPALEVYAHGELQTNPINPNTVSASTIAYVITHVSQQEYPKALASRMSYDVPSQDR